MGFDHPRCQKTRRRPPEDQHRDDDSTSVPAVYGSTERTLRGPDMRVVRSRIGSLHGKYSHQQPFQLKIQTPFHQQLYPIYISG